MRFGNSFCGCHFRWIWIQSNEVEWGAVWLSCCQATNQQLIVVSIFAKMENCIAKLWKYRIRLLNIRIKCTHTAKAHRQSKLSNDENCKWFICVLQINRFGVAMRWDDLNHRHSPEALCTYCLEMRFLCAHQTMHECVVSAEIKCWNMSQDIYIAKRM